MCRMGITWGPKSRGLIQVPILPITSYEGFVMSHTLSGDVLSLIIKWESQKLWWLYNVSTWLVRTIFPRILFLVCFWLGYATSETLESGGWKGSHRHFISLLAWSSSWSAIVPPSTEGSSFKFSHSWARCICLPLWQRMHMPSVEHLFHQSQRQLRTNMSFSPSLWDSRLCFKVEPTLDIPQFISIFFSWLTAL